jgi:hypothetical protein
MPATSDVGRRMSPKTLLPALLTAAALFCLACGSGGDKAESGPVPNYLNPWMPAAAPQPAAQASAPQPQPPAPAKPQPQAPPVRPPAPAPPARVAPVMAQPNASAPLRTR